MTRGMGRPTNYTQEIALEICTFIAEGNSLRSFCEIEGTPSRTSVFKWLRENPDFANQYARARAEQADYYADQIIEIADQENLDHNDRKVKIDARKWVASKLKPQKYGDKTTTELTGKDGGPIEVSDPFEGLTPEERLRKMKFVTRRLEEQIKQSNDEKAGDGGDA